MCKRCTNFEKVISKTWQIIKSAQTCNMIHKSLRFISAKKFWFQRHQDDVSYFVRRFYLSLYHSIVFVFLTCSLQLAGNLKESNFFVDPPKTTKTTRAKPVFVLNHTCEVRISKRDQQAWLQNNKNNKLKTWLQKWVKNLTQKKESKAWLQKGVKNLTLKKESKTWFQNNKNIKLKSWLQKRSQKLDIKKESKSWLQKGVKSLTSKRSQKRDSKNESKIWLQKGKTWLQNNKNNTLKTWLQKRSQKLHSKAIKTTS